MMKKIFTNWKVILLIFAVSISIFLIHPDPNAEGVAIRSVARNSSAALAGFVSPDPSDKPMFREVIYSIDGQMIRNIEDYQAAVSGLSVNETLVFRTKSSYYYEDGKRKFSFLRRLDKTYKVVVRPEIELVTLNETVMKPFTEQVNITLNDSADATASWKIVNKTVYRSVPKVEKKIIGVEDIGLDVYDAPKTNLKKGLDLQGGMRIVLAPENSENITDDNLDIVKLNLERRLNIYGLSDIVIRPVSDLEGNKLLIVEIAGANEEEVRNLIGQQGKFEAKVGNTTVFLGGQDIVSVCRSPECSGIDRFKGCGIGSDGHWYCPFHFTIVLSPDAAQKQADATRNLDVVIDDGQKYLSEKLRFFLDDEFVDELSISEGLKGEAVTTISISGSGSGNSYSEAETNALKNMKNLQTILLTGSLPVKLNIVKVDSVSPTLGGQFLKNAIIVGIGALLSVVAVVMIRYRQLKIAVPMLITMLSEVIIILGFAAIAGWNLDLAAIAGIIIAVGTGVDDQVVIVDETRDKEALSWKDRLKRAFFIIFAAFFTTLFAMVPLLWAGAGLLRGFAIITIVGILAGVFISRPAFAHIIETLSD